MIRIILPVWGAVAFIQSAAAASTTPGNVSFTEERKSKVQSNAFYDKAKESAAKAEAKEVDFSKFIQSSITQYQKYNNRVRVPGFISATPLPQIGRIVGPTSVESTTYRMGDTLFVRWSGAPMPKVGERFSTFTPAVVLQNLSDPTDFEVYLPLGPHATLPRDRRMAGYFYEATGRVKVKRVRGGLVEMFLEQVYAQITVGNEIMATPPLVENITPIRSGIQLSAAVVCGNPHDRISSTSRSFIYINRGSRDGIRVGRVFESLDSVRLDESVRGRAPELSNGEAIVVHTTDSFSTAMITKQFDVIRVGSLLRTKQEDSLVEPKISFSGLADPEPKSSETGPDLKQPEVPNLQDLPGSKDESLPEPRKRPSAPPLSELDELEKNLTQKNLTPAEQARLDKLSKQEKLGTSHAEDSEDDLAGTPGVPTVENSFKDGKKTAKKDSKKGKKKSKNDEEELNLLMMQN